MPFTSRERGDASSGPRAKVADSALAKISTTVEKLVEISKGSRAGVLKMPVFVGLSDGGELDAPSDERFADVILVTRW